MKEKKQTPLSGWIMPIVFFLLGLLVRVCLVGYSFSAYLLWVCAALAAGYQLLNLLMRRYPGLALWLRRILTLLVVLFTALLPVLGQMGLVPRQKGKLKW